jgi:UDP:flavonoid glycosyltransferase YjiC (YdhE family)
MSTVLLGWELGEGLGHVAPLLAVAHELAARGHAPVLAVKDFAVAQPLLRDVPFPVLRAPTWWEPAPASFRASSFADILAIRGFADADGLALLVNAWQALIDLTKAELVISEFAPSPCLAAYGVVPTVVMGSGFAVPPAHGHEFPRLGPRFGTVRSSDQILEVVHTVQRRRGRPAPATLPALMAGSARFVGTIAELDAYKDTRQGDLVEPMRPLAPPLPAAAAGSFFAYLNAAQPGVELVLTQLAAAGFHGAAYLRHGSPRVFERARAAGVTIHQNPPPLGEALAGAAVVIHHGGINTAEAALAAGRPQVLLPSHLEHTLTARALESLGVGKSLTGPYQAGELGSSLREVSGPGDCSRRAEAFAHEISARNYRGCLTAMIECCGAQLA